MQDESALTMYLPYLQAPSPEFFSFMTFLVRTSNDPANLTSTVRESIKDLDNEVPISSVATLAQLIAEATSEPRFNAVVVSLFGIQALLLATIGIHGILSYWVTLRTHEIGIRTAIGATQTDILKLVVGRVCFSWELA